MLAPLGTLKFTLYPKIVVAIAVNLVNISLFAGNREANTVVYLITKVHVDTLLNSKVKSDTVRYNVQKIDSDESLTRVN